MKKIALLLLLFITISTYSQIDYNIYIGNTKKEICKSLKEDGFKYSLIQKMYVDIDSTGKWILSENYYTYLLCYSNTRALFTFDNKTDRCVKYFLLCEDLENYWNYFDYYTKILEKINTENELIWIEKRHKYYVEINLKALNSKQFKIFTNSKSYKTYKIK